MAARRPDLPVPVPVPGLVGLVVVDGVGGADPPPDAANAATALKPERPTTAATAATVNLARREVGKWVLMSWFSLANIGLFGLTIGTPRL